MPLALMAFSRVFPLLTYYHSYPQLSDIHQREWALPETHHSLIDCTGTFGPPKEIGATLAAPGAVEIRSGLGGNGVEARC